MLFLFFFFQAEDGIRDLVRSRGLGDVYKRQIQYHVSPVFSTRVDVDSSTCSGPINLSVQNSGIVSYQWYENGQIIPNANLSALEVTHPGDYFVEVTGNYSSDYFQGGVCTVQSELIHISGPEIQLYGDTLFTLSVADHYEWYLDCLLYTSPSPRDRTRSRMPSSA